MFRPWLPLSQLLPFAQVTMASSKLVHGHKKPREFPQDFGRYRLLDLIAIGGMAEVFMAEMQGPLGFRRRVAIKRILPHLIRNKEFVRAFVDEARLGGLLVHPHIVQILDFDFVDEIPYLAMEFVEGGHLGRVMQRARAQAVRIPVEYIVALFVQVARGVEFAHRACDGDGKPLKLIHRDLKPSNMLLGLDGQVKLADFGIAKASSNLTHTTPDTIKGSLPYMSPEQANGSKMLTGASDLFSMGAGLFEMLTLERLFKADCTPIGLLGAVARGPSPERLALLDGLPSEARPLIPIVSRLLQTRPEDRYPDAGAFVAAVEALGYQTVSTENMAAFAQTWLGEAPVPASPARPDIAPPPTPRLEDQDTQRKDPLGGTTRPLRDPAGAPGPQGSDVPTTLEIQTETTEVPGNKPDGARAPVPSHHEKAHQEGTNGDEASCAQTADLEPLPPQKASEADTEQIISVDDTQVGAETTRLPMPPSSPLPHTRSRPLFRGRPMAWIGIILTAFVVGLGLLLPQLLGEKADSTRQEAKGAWIYVLSDPAGIPVLIDGEPSGKTPIEFRLRKDTKRVLVELRPVGETSRTWTGTVAPHEHRVVDFPAGGLEARSWIIPGTPSETDAKSGAQPETTR